MISRDHYQNRERFPQEELAKYHGKHVAWNFDGTRILASGNDDSEVFHKVKAAGYQSDDFILSYVPFPNEVFWGGAFTLEGEAGD